MCSASLRAVAVVSFVVICSVPSETQSQKPSDPSAEQQRVWFAVEERPRSELRIEPIAIVSDHELTHVPTLCSSENSGNEAFASQSLKEGQTYPISFGGSPGGEVHILTRVRGLTAATASYDGPLKLRGQTRALASNQASSEFRPESRQAATKEDRTAALALATDIFRQHGIREELIPKIHADFVTRTVIAPSPLPTWIASFTLETVGEDYLQHNLFFIATQGSSKLDPEFIWVRISTKADEDETAQFVDHADLLGDGQDEVVIRFTSTENHHYAIYKKNRDGLHWEQIFITEPLECNPY
jgi:hypothetical protein